MSGTLGRRASLCVSAGVVAHTLWTSAAPALTYRLYAAEWHLNHTVTTSIFAVYPVVVVAVLTAFGDVSDHIGRRTTMLAGLAASLAGTLVLAGAPDVAWLFAGRILMGIGVGLSAGPSAAAVLAFSKGNGPVVTTAAQSGGFAAALLLGGALTQYAPWPTRLPFWLLGALLGLLLVAAWFLPNDEPAGRAWRPRIPHVPAPARGPFLLAAFAVMSAYTHGVLVLSLGGEVAHDLIGSANALVNGAVLSLFAIVFGAAGIGARSLRTRRAIMLGAAASAAGMALLAAAIPLHDLRVFLLSTVAAGVGYGLLFRGALEVVGAAAPAGQRGGMMSALFLLAYLSMGTVAAVLGAVATARGLATAIDLGAAVIGALSLVTFILAAADPAITGGVAPRVRSPEVDARPGGKLGRESPSRTIG